MPELSDIEEYITMSLQLTNGSKRIIFAGKSNEDQKIPVDEISKFIGLKL